MEFGKKGARDDAKFSSISDLALKVIEARWLKVYQPSNKFAN